MKGVFFFKAQVYQKSGMGFTLCDRSLHFTNILYKSIFTTIFPILQKYRNGENTSLVLFLSLKILGSTTQGL
jgi:hypothetical protein